MVATPRAIPPSSATKEAARNRNDDNYSPKPKTKSIRRSRGGTYPSSFLWLTGVCLLINILLMTTAFIFHANWMPRATNPLTRSILRGRKRLWGLLRGVSTPQQQQAANDVSEEVDSGNPSADEGDLALGQLGDLPFTVGNSPNEDATYDLSKQQYHVIFSTGCSDKQHWQSYMLFYSMVTSEQTGQVTRIASGCSELESKQLDLIHKTQIEPMGMDMPYKGKSRFHLHMTPEFGEGFHYNK